MASTPISKPLTINSIWASSGDIIQPDNTKIQSGWAAEIPPRQYFNWIDNRQDQAIAHINQYGVPLWDSLTPYLGGSSVVIGSSGTMYKAKIDSTNQNPDSDTSFTYWDIWGLNRTQTDARYLKSASNLSDLGNTATARTNLGAAALAGSSTQAFSVSTPAVDDNSNLAASTAYYVNQGSSTNPLVNGTAAAGTSKRWARQDHIHPTDTSRAAINGDSGQVFNVATATLSTHSVSLGQADGRYAKLSGALMTGAFGITAGTSGAPGLYISGDTTTGIYQPTSNAISVAISGVEKIRVNANGVQVGTSSAPSFTRLAAAASGSGNNAIAGYTSGGTQIMAVTESAGGTTVSSNAAAACVYVEKNTTSNRSINTGGTVNTSGADYAEYEKKSTSCGVVAKGDIVGFDVSGLLVDKFSNAIRFGVKSTSPSYVGGDTWGSEVEIGQKPTPPSAEANDDVINKYKTDMATWTQKYEQARASVDRVAYSGKVPVNVLDASVGDWIVPFCTSSGKIGGKAVADKDITFDQYRIAVGRVNRILPDGRAEIAVKVA